MPPPEEVDLQPRVDGLIEALRDDEPAVRTLARAELRRLGPLAEGRLRANVRHPDVDIASRCAELLARLETRTGDAGAGLISKVVYVDPEGGFVAIEAGRAEGVAGHRFEILRGRRWIATACFEKYLGGTASRSKLRITAGRGVDIRLDDEAVGF